MSNNQDGCEWVSFFWYQPTRVMPDNRSLNGRVSVLFTVKSPLFTFLVLIRVNMISTMHSNAECASVQLYHITILHNGM